MPQGGHSKSSACHEFGVWRHQFCTSLTLPCRAGASHVTTVDVAAGAIQAANANWALNGLDSASHSGHAGDAFAFLDTAAKAREVRFSMLSNGLIPGVCCVCRAQTPLPQVICTAVVVYGAHVSAGLTELLHITAVVQWIVLE